MAVSFTTGDNDEPDRSGQIFFSFFSVLIICITNILCFVSNETFFDVGDSAKCRARWLSSIIYPSGIHYVSLSVARFPVFDPTYTAESAFL